MKTSRYTEAQIIVILRQAEGIVPSSADRIAAIIHEKAPELVRVGMETGPQAVWLWHALRKHGIMVDCIHARCAAAALKLQANKTDRNDAFGLARLVHSGWYELVAIKSFDRYRMRAVLTARERIVRMCTTMISAFRRAETPLSDQGLGQDLRLDVVGWQRASLRGVGSPCIAT